MTARHRPVDAVRTDGPVADTVAREEPLAVRVAARGGDAVPVWTTLRTPGHDRELALGWCVAEGIVAGIDEIADVHHCDADGVVDPNAVTVRLDRPDLPDLSGLRRTGTSTAACGLCGRDQLHALLDRCAPSPRRADVARHAVRRAVGALADHQPLFATTGGVHAAGLADDRGRLLVVREDVGRHNAVDAAVGAAVRDRLEPSVLVLSGRAGFELVAKAVMARVPVVAAVGAATDLAVRTAAEAGITLVAFAAADHGGTVLTNATGLAAAR